MHSAHSRPRSEEAGPALLGGAAVLPARVEFMGGPVRGDWLRGGSSSENGVTGGAGTALRAVEGGGGTG